MEFYVPATSTAESADHLYKEFAAKAGATPAPLADRVRSIHFRHDGEGFSAAVGTGITGPTPLSEQDNALVLAIFEGESLWRIATSAFHHESHWNDYVSVDPRTVSNVEYFGTEP